MTKDTTMLSTADEPTAIDLRWTTVGPVERIAPDRGVAALVDGIPVAVFRLADVDGTGERFAAIDHVDPATGAPIMARGLVGSVGEVTTVASPLHKQRYSLDSGECLDDSSLSVRVFEVAIIDGMVNVRVPDEPRTIS